MVVPRLLERGRREPKADGPDLVLAQRDLSRCGGGSSSSLRHLRARSGADRLPPGLRPEGLGAVLQKAPSPRSDALHRLSTSRRCALLMCPSHEVGSSFSHGRSGHGGKGTSEPQVGRAPFWYQSRRGHKTNGRSHVKSRYLCPTLASVPVSHSAARLRLLGDTGLGTCVPPIPRPQATSELNPGPASCSAPCSPAREARRGQGRARFRACAPRSRPCCRTPSPT